MGPPQGTKCRHCRWKNVSTRIGRTILPKGPPAIKISRQLFQPKIRQCLPTMAINFSHGAAQLIGQYYNFVYYIFEDYRNIHLRMQDVAV